MLIAAMSLPAVSLTDDAHCDRRTGNTATTRTSTRTPTTCRPARQPGFCGTTNSATRMGASPGTQSQDTSSYKTTRVVVEFEFWVTQDRREHWVGRERYDTAFALCCHCLPG